MPLEDVCLVTVNYRGTTGIGRLLESLTRLEARQRLRVVIVHNGATARSREDLERIVAGYPGRVEVWSAMTTSFSPIPASSTRS